MNAASNDIFELAMTKGIFTNVFAGPILGNYDRPSLMPIGNELVPTAIPGHPETITFWGLDGDMMTGHFVQLTVAQAIDRVNALNAQFEALGVPTVSPQAMFDGNVRILDLMFGHEPMSAEQGAPHVELTGVHHYGHVEF